MEVYGSFRATGRVSNPDAASLPSSVLACGLPVQVGAAAQVLSDEVRDALRRKWEEVVTPATGAADYASLRAQISWYKQQKAAAVR